MTYYNIYESNKILKNIIEILLKIRAYKLKIISIYPILILYIIYYLQIPTTVRWNESNTFP